MSQFASNAQFNLSLLMANLLHRLNPLVPGMQNVKIRQFIIGCLLRFSIVKRLACLDAHYSERQGLIGLILNSL